MAGIERVMSTATETVGTTQPRDALRLFVAEIQLSTTMIADLESDALITVARKLRSAERVFIIAAGRSGLALRMTAMRLMHLGLEVHVVGDVTTPAITVGDVLLAASGSGTTTGIVSAARKAVESGAEVVAISTTKTSPLSDVAVATIVIPAATKQDHDGTGSQQYSGGLFEQTLVLVGDSIFHTLWKDLGESSTDLWMRHANLE